MKKLTDFILESQAKKDNVFVVYFNDNTMDNYFDNKEDAEARKDELNKEMPDNECTVKEEPRSNFEK